MPLRLISNFFNTKPRKQAKIIKYCISKVAIEAVVRRCSVTKMFTEFPQNSSENTSAGVSSLIKLHASRLELY